MGRSSYSRKSTRRDENRLYSGGLNSARVPRYYLTGEDESHEEGGLEDVTNRELYFVEKPNEEYFYSRHFKKWQEVFERVKGNDFDKAMRITFKNTKTAKKQAGFNRTSAGRATAVKARRLSSITPQTYKQLIKRRSQTTLTSKKNSIVSPDMVSSSECEIESIRAAERHSSSTYRVLADSNLPRVVWESQMRR